MKTLTIFTPAYNRAHTLGRTYESLCRQTCKDFEWLIVDDGSTDNTKELVDAWIGENKIPIRYIYQENQGMHGAHNTAFRNIETELNVCIDSDDWMPENAVQSVITHWDKYRTSDYAGIVGLDVSTDGKIIGSSFPDSLHESTLHDYYRNGGKGDKKVVLSTTIAKRYPEYPRFEGERYFSLGYKFHLIDQDFKFLFLNTPLVVVDYQQDGSSYNMWKQYWNNPQGFMFLRKEYLRLYKSPKLRLRNCIHYIAHCIRAKKIRELLNNSCPILTFFLIPAGYVLYHFTKRKVRMGKLMKLQ